MLISRRTDRVTHEGIVLDQPKKWPLRFIGCKNGNGSRAIARKIPIEQVLRDDHCVGVVGGERSPLPLGAVFSDHIAFNDCVFHRPEK